MVRRDVPSGSAWPRRSLAGLATAALFGVVATPVGQTHPQTTFPRGDIGLDPPCAAVPAGKVTYERVVSNDEPVSEPAPAKVTEYDIPGGTVAYEVVPPKGWSPLTATAAELRSYGFPQRPTNAALLAGWQQAFANWKGFSSGDVCVRKGVSHAYYSTLYSENWSGFASVDGGATQASGTFKQGSFVEACPHQSAHGTWAGLGGYKTSRLIQAGTDVFIGNLNDDYAWWEILNHDIPVDTGEVVESLEVNAGDTISTSTTYKAASGGNQAVAEFSTTNATTGYSEPPVIVTAVQGYPVADFYDGSTADYIDERTTYNGSLADFRKPASGYISWYDVQANGTPLDAHAYDGVFMTHNGQSNGSFLGYPNQTSSDPFNFDDDWASCE